MKKLLYILMGALMLTSCSDFLDVKPVGKLIPTKIQEAERLLNYEDTYDWDFLNNNLGSTLAILGDNLEYSTRSFAADLTPNNPNVDKPMAYKFNRPYEDPKNQDYVWNNQYEAIYYFNNVIAVSEELKSQDEKYANQVIAQAKAARAMSFLNLCYVYGPSYKKGAANDTRTIPMRTAHSATEKNPDLSTTEQVFAQVEADLKDALALNIPEFTSPVRYNSISVKAALAYVYMLKGEYSQMLTYADQAWTAALAAKGGEAGLFYDYNKFQYIDNGQVPAPGIDPEVNFSLKYDDGSDNTFDQAISKEVLLFRRMAKLEDKAYASQEYLSLFADSDQRKRLFLLSTNGYQKAGEGDDGIVKKNMRTKKMDRGNTSGFSYPELLLMRAEAYARNTKPTEALADLNTLRKYRYATGTPALTGLTGDDLLNEILAERRRELPTPSHKRFVDLKRYAAHDGGKPWAKATMVHHLMTYEAGSAPVPSGTSFTADIDSEYYILPISNTVLIHNPEWGIPLAPEDYNPS